jgi:hypothetical protein
LRSGAPLAVVGRVLPAPLPPAFAELHAAISGMADAAAAAAAIHRLRRRAERVSFIRYASR